MRNRLLDEMYEKKIIAIVRGVPSSAMPDVAEAALAGGVSMLEITFDHTSGDGAAETLRSLELLAGKLAGRLSLGAGTVLTPAEVDEAHKCGAGYIISPNVDPAVIARTRELGLVSMPGAFTPTEVVAAHTAGADVVKLFPAVIGGPDYIKAVRGPLAHIPLAAVGGVDADNLADFFKAGVVCVGIGGNLVNAKKVAAGDLASITQSARTLTTRLASI